MFRRIYRISRWFTLGILVLTLILILRPALPPRVVTTPDGADSAAAKIQRFQSSAMQGRPERLEMDESELNGWLENNLVIKNKGSGESGAAAVSGLSPASASRAADLAVDQVTSSVREVMIALRENSLLTYVSFELYGMGFSLELEGRPMVRDGHFRLEPTRGRLGSLPLSASLLAGAAHRIFDAPENRERFRLSPLIRNVVVEGGRLVISPGPESGN
jgi:hypothetical protein